MVRVAYTLSASELFFDLRRQSLVSGSDIEQLLPGLGVGHDLGFQQEFFRACSPAGDEQ
jgi:hypothetical protein